MKRDQLQNAAVEARQNAYAPYSGFKVGAALAAASGAVYAGCNIENASFGLTICAERVAVFTALAAGERSFERMVVAADTERLTPPCGPCRQIIWEFCGDLPLELINLADGCQKINAGELLPQPFDGGFLGKEGDDDS